MQHQAQIDAARTATGYDYTDYFKLIKEEIGKADIAIGKSGGNPSVESPIGGIRPSVPPTNI